MVHCCRNNRTKSHPTFIRRSETLGFAADDADIFQFSAHRAGQREDTHRVKGVGLNRSVGIEVIQIGIDEINGSRFASALSRIDDDDCVIAVEQSEREIKCTNAEIYNANRVRHRTLPDAPRDFAAKAVITDKYVADTGDENHAINSSSSTEKKNRCPGCRIRPRSFPGSSSITTATWVRLSKSCSMDSTIPMRFLKARSKTSPPAFGLRRTRSPRFNPERTSRIVP